MYSTFHHDDMYAAFGSAFGTWPVEGTSAANNANSNTRSSGLNEQFSFYSEENPKSTQPVFTFKSNGQSSGKIFVPPFFVPPGATEGGLHTASAASSAEAISTQSHAGPAMQNDAGDNIDHSNQDNDVMFTNENGERSASPAPDVDFSNSMGPVEHSSAAQQPSDENARIPSPPPSAELEAEKAELWSTKARKQFHDMVTAPGYINRYRLHMKKRERTMQFLQNLDQEPLLCDGSRDHQTKYQAAHWTIINGKLYRKPESGRVARYRRHLDGFEAWDVLTTEHVRSGHLGRDKLRKVLEQNYIGYTLQEIMFVLKECKKCAGRGSNADRTSSNDDLAMVDAPESIDTAIADHVQVSSETPDRPTAISKGPYGRQQTSNCKQIDVQTDNSKHVCTAWNFIRPKHCIFYMRHADPFARCF